MPFWCGIRCKTFLEDYGCGCVWAVAESLSYKMFSLLGGSQSAPTSDCYVAIVLHIAVIYEHLSNVEAEIITELACFTPEVCICTGNSLEFKGESVSVIKIFCQHPHRSLSLCLMETAS